MGLSSETEERAFNFLNSNNSRIICDDVCEGDSMSQFVCDLCLKNKRILQSCDTTLKTYKRLGNDSLNVINVVNEYCENNWEIDQASLNHFTLESHISMGITDSVHYDIIKEHTCYAWQSNSESGDCGSLATEPYFNGWGMLIRNRFSENNISLHVNHPLSDNNTPHISSYIFEDIKAKWMIIAGAHRDSWVDIDEPQDCIYSNVGCGVNYGADVARNMDSCYTNYYTTPFQIFHERISTNNYCTNEEDGLLSLSIHGFQSQVLDSNVARPSFIISNGNRDDDKRQDICIPPDSISTTILHMLRENFSNNSDYNYYCASNDSIAVIVQKEISCDEITTPVSCGNQEYSPYSRFSAYSNPQGRYTNNVDTINENTENDIWIHIEIDSCIRDNYSLYKETSSIISEAVRSCYLENNCIFCDQNTPCSENDLYFDEECNCLNNTGDINNDGLYNVIDIVALVNCVLANNCIGCTVDMNSDDVNNVLDIVALANCVLANNCDG